MACVAMCNRTLAQIELKWYCSSISCWALVCALFTILQYVVFDLKALQRKYCTWFSIWIVKRQIKRGELRLEPGVFVWKKLCVFIKCLPHRKSLKWIKRCCSQAHVIIFIWISSLISLLRNHLLILNKVKSNFNVALFARRSKLIEIYPRNKMSIKLLSFRSISHPNHF